MQPATPDEAREISKAIGGMEIRPGIIGVFVDEEPDEVNRLAEYCKLNGVQLSGGERLDYWLKIIYPVIKVIHISPQSRVRTIIEDIGKTQSNNIRYMLDTGAGSYGGGSGVTFNWRLAGRIASRFPVTVAGGLIPENVGRLIEEVRPWGVDVSSGVETHGRKDKVKISQFIDAVRKVDRSVNR